MATKSAKNRKPAGGNGAKDKKMSYDDFIVAGIKRLRKKGHKGIHVVYSGFNAAFLEYFSVEARAFVDDAAKRQLVQVRPARGGAIICMFGDAEMPPKVSDVLAKIVKA